MKRCYRCGEIKDLSQFSGIRRKSSECKPCAAKLQSEYRARRRRDSSTNGAYPPAGKACPDCGETKIQSCYYRVDTSSDGLSAYCKECTCRRQREYTASIPHEKKRERLRKRWLSNIYGISQEQYDALVSSQGSKCWICGKPAEGERNGKLSVDHNHVTDEVRGLLCQMCNAGVGMFCDSVENLSRAIEYLTVVPARSVLVPRGE